MIQVDSPDNCANTLVRQIEIGEIKAAFGVKGWVKIFSFTRPIENIFEYKHWFIGNSANYIEVEDSQVRPNKGLIAKLKGIEDRNQAQMLIGSVICVNEDSFSPLQQGEFYWSQLIGLDVVNKADDHLGQVVQMIETGANDVLVVKDDQTQRLIPYAKSVVVKVSIENHLIVVDWEPDY